MNFPTVKTVQDSQIYRLLNKVEWQLLFVIKVLWAMQSTASENLEILPNGVTTHFAQTIWCADYLDQLCTVYFMNAPILVWCVLIIYCIEGNYERKFLRTPKIIRSCWKICASILGNKRLIVRATGGDCRLLGPTKFIVPSLLDMSPEEIREFSDGAPPLVKCWFENNCNISI